MTGKEYQKLAMRTNDGKNTYRMIKAVTKSLIADCNLILDGKDDRNIGGIVNACLGLSGEVGELNDMIKKWIFHEKTT